MRCKGHVRFTPNSDRESGFPREVMSTLPLKTDMCGAFIYVCFGPIADIPFAVQNMMSALDPKADMCAAARDVCYGPKADIFHPTRVTHAGG
jgi:hypothetical protein